MTTVIYTDGPQVDSVSTEHPRLVVVVQDAAPHALLAAWLVEVARLHDLDVLLFGLASDAAGEGRLRRELVPLAGLIREARLRVELTVSSGRMWITTLKALLRADDVLACAPSETPGRGGQNLVDALSSMRRGALHVFAAGLPRPSEPPGFRRSVAPWLISALLILGFFWLDVRISQLLSGDILTITTIALLAPEIGLIWLANAMLA